MQALQHDMEQGIVPAFTLMLAGMRGSHAERTVRRCPTTGGRLIDLCEMVTIRLCRVEEHPSDQRRDRGIW
jgi:hypothetical protein